ncbi:MAG: hypothetical protein WAM14_16425, partial [Candidatus Nitrosopolaris sp.]
FMVAIMFALALTLATVGMTTLTQHALAYGEGAQPGDNCYHKFYYPCDNSGGSYSGYAYIQPAYAQDCTRPDSSCYGDSYNQQGTYHNVDYGGIWVTPSGFSCWDEWRCASGWNHAIVDAPRDYANNNYDPSCNDHTQAYCNGYTQGYVYAWNIEVNNQNPSQSQQTIQQQGCTIIGSPGSTCTQTEQSAQGQNQ